MTGLSVVTIITCKSVNDRSDCSYVLLLVKVLMTGLSVVTLLLVKVLMTGLIVVMYYYL